MAQQLLKNIKQIVIHCTATLPQQKAGFNECYQWHVVENGWGAIGYHYGIEQDGNIWQGRAINFGKDKADIGAHAAGHNKGTLAIVLSGGCSDIYKDENGDTVYVSTDTFTAIQKTNLKALVTKLIERCIAAGARGIEVVGHRDLNPNKDCPSFDVKAWWLE